MRVLQKITATFYDFTMRVHEDVDEVDAMEEDISTENNRNITL